MFFCGFDNPKYSFESYLDTHAFVRCQQPLGAVMGAPSSDGERTRPSGELQPRPPGSRDGDLLEPSDGEDSHRDEEPPRRGRITPEGRTGGGSAGGDARRTGGGSHWRRGTPGVDLLRMAMPTTPQH